ncbi:MAG: sodium/proton-translocating pyrophosphatase, partial [Alphaproteobacteria bacterium]
MLYAVMGCGVLAVVYGIFTRKQVLAADAGTERMQEISAAIQQGADAYLKRQYRTIAFVGAIVIAVLTILLGWQVSLGFLVGALLSGATGFIGMNISVKANVRVAEGARQGLARGLELAFKAGAITGMLVAGLALLAVAGYYMFLLDVLGATGRGLIDPLVGLGFGASLISIFARL